MENEHTYPFFLRVGLSLLSLAILAAAIYIGQDILVPILFSILLAALLLPVTKFLNQKGVGKVLSISITIVCSMTLLGIVVYFLSTQIGNFLDDMPSLEKRFHQLAWSTQKWVQENWNIGMKAQNKYIEQTTENMKSNSPELLSKTVVTLTTVLSYVIFLPIYTFLLLYHKDTIKRFLIEIFKDGNKEKVTEVLQESQLISQQYITGLLIELCIVFVMNAAGFLILGIKYPIFLALLAAILNIVPYIGMIVASIICIIVTLMSSTDSADAIWVGVILTVVQLIDNNIIMPWIVGNKVKLNALAIIIGVLIGGALAGVSGMFLAIPTLAVMKVIFERVDTLQAWAILLGETAAEEQSENNPVKRTFSHIKQKRSDKPRRKTVARHS